MDSNFYPDTELQEINFVSDNSQLLSVLQTIFKQQIDNHSNKDVRLHAGGKVTKLHSWIFSLWSPLFRSLVTQTDPYLAKPYVDILLPEFTHQETLLFSQFLYSGELRLKQRQLGRMKALLKLFRISLVLEVYTEHKAETADNTVSAEKAEVSTDLEDLETVTTSEVVLWELNSQSSRKSFLCEQCDKVFRTSKGLNNHNQIHHFGNSKHQCDVCSKVFSRKESLMNHMKSHTGDYHECLSVGCGKRFVNERDLLDHENIHTGSKEFLCAVCGETFPSRKRMLNHKEKHKRNDEPCSICGVTLKSRASYHAHMKSHRIQKGHFCKQCNRSFKRNYDLKVHMRIHTGAKPYSCPDCCKPFSLSSSLSKHRRLIHSHKETVIYPCAVCEKSFSKQEDADAHKHLENINTQTSQDTSIQQEILMPGREGSSDDISLLPLSLQQTRIVHLGIQNITQPLYVKFD